MFNGFLECQNIDTDTNTTFLGEIVFFYLMTDYSFPAIKLAAILDFSKKYWPQVIKFMFNGFLGCQNMGIDTNKSFLCEIVFILWQIIDFEQ